MNRGKKTGEAGERIRIGMGWVRWALALTGCLGGFVVNGAEPPAPTISWVGALNQLWSNPLNWTPARVPNSTDHVLINAATNSTVTMDVSASIGSLALGAESGTVTQRLVLNSGVGLNVTTNSLIRARAELVLPDGDNRSLSGAGLLEIRGTLDWTGGRLFGAYYVAPQGRVLMRGGNNMRLTSGTDAAPAAFTNAGTVIWFGGERLYAYNNSQIQNLGRWELAGEGIALGHCCSGAGATFRNTGTLVKTVGTNVTTMQSFALINEGTVAATEGTLRLPSVGTEWREGGQIGAGSGKVQLENGAATLAGHTTLNGTFEWLGDNLDVSGSGTLSGPVPLEWISGTLQGALTIPADGVVNLRGGQYVRLNSGNDLAPAALTNFGLVIWHGGDRLLAYRSAQIHNAGEWRLAADGLAISHCCAGGWGEFHNFGLLTKTSGTNVTRTESITIQNRGTVNAAFGTLQIDSNSEWLDGTRITGAGRVVVGGGSATLGGTITVNANWEWAGPSVFGNAVMNGQGPLVWRTGRLFGALTISPGSRLNLTGEYYPELGSDSDGIPAAITNRGTVTWPGGYPLYARRSAQIYNQGVWRLEADGLAFQHNCCGGWPSFYNLGTLAKTAGTNDTIFGNSFTDLRGTIQVAAGTLRFDQSTIWSEGNQITGSGRVMLAGGNATLAGTTTLNGSWQWAGANILGTGGIAGPVPLVWRTGRLFGALNIPSGSRLNFSGEYYPELGSDSDGTPAVITNRGTVAWPGGYPFYARRSSEIYNHGTWRLEADGIALQHNCCGGWPTFHNFGTLAKSGGTNDSVFGNSVTHHRGTVQAGVGTIRFDQSTTWFDGNQINGSGRVLLPGGNATLVGTTILNGSWQWAGANIGGTGVVAGPIPLVWRIGRVFGNVTIAPGSRLNFTGESLPELGSDSDGIPAVLTNRGTVSWPGGTPLYARRSAQIYNQGQWRLEGPGLALQHNCCGGWPSLYNADSLLKTGEWESSLGNVSFYNSGRLTVEAGQLTLNQPPANSGEFHFPLRGAVAATNYGSLRIFGPYAHQGTLRVEFANGYTPARGDQFDLVAGNNLSGGFANTVLPSLPSDIDWTIDYSPTLARLRVADPCLANGLMGWWAAEGSTDDQTTSYPGSFFGDTTYAPGLVGQAFSFDGVGDAVNLGNWSPGTRWTLQAWVKLNAIQSGRRAILGGLNECRDWALTVTDGYLGLTYRQAGGCTITLTNVARAATNVWYHVAGTYDGMNVALYMNGTPIGTAAAEVNYLATSGPRIGGATYNSNAENLAGLVDEATIHNRPLTGLEIAGTYNSGAAGRCSQLGLGILTFSPQGLVTTDVTNFAVRFNQPFNTNSFTIADLTVVGPTGPISPSSYQIVPVAPFDGRAFNIRLPALTNEGLYSVTIGPSVLTLGGQPMPLPYTATFNLDKAAPTVIAFSPTSPVTNQTSVLEATFSEAMSGASAGLDDVIINGSGGSFATGISQLASNQFRITLNRPFAQGSQTVILRGIRDLAGNTMVPYTNVLSVQNPDLSPGIVASPAVALAGQSVSLVYNVTNLGNVAAPGAWRASFLMSTNANGANATLLGTANVAPSIAAGATLQLTQSIVFPPGLAGARYLGVGVDTTDLLVESIETNNTAWAGNLTSVSAPDLTALALAAPSSAARGSSIDVTWIRTNRGSAATFVAGQDRLFLSANSNNIAGAQLLAAVPGLILDAGASVTRTQSVILPLSSTLPAGAYYLVVAIDSPDAQAEADESNNLASQPLALTDPPLPDLAFDEVNLPTLLVPGAVLEVRWTVTNAGTLGLTNAVWRERVSFSSEISGPLALADFVFTNSLAASQSIARTQTVVCPVDLAAGSGWLRVALDFGNAIVEANEANNTIDSDVPADVAAYMNVTLSPATLEEGAAPVLATVRRNGRTHETAIVTLTNNWPTRLVMPSQLVLTAGLAQAQFTVGYPRNAQPEGQRIVHIGLTATNYFADHGLLSLVDDSQPTLALTLQTNRLREGLTLAATVSRGFAAPEPVEVLVAAADPLSLTVPFSVIIPSNQMAYTFGVLAPDDTFFNGSRTNQLRVAAIGYAEANSVVTVDDDDLPTIQLQLSPGAVSENAGPQAASLTVTLSGPAPRNVVLDLESSDPTRARVPAAITIPAGQTVGAVSVEVTDNVGFGSNAPVHFRGLIHEANSYQYIGQTPIVTLNIVDNEGPSLALRLDRDLVDEGLSPAAQATISRNGSTANALVVTLQSSDPTEATVPPTVTIPAGQVSATFPVTSISDGQTDGAQRATIAATAANHNAASAVITVSDLDLPDYRVVSVNGPSTAVAESSFTMNYRVQNQGRVLGASNLLTKIYLRTDPLAFGGILVGSYTLSAPLPVGQFFEQSLQGRFPDRVGRYYLVVQTDPDGRIAEGLEDNNVLVSAPIELTAPWTATVQTTVTSAAAGTPIPISGRATRPGGAPVTSTLVSVHVMHEGFLRTIAAFTDATGNYATTFYPLAGEAGLYELGAGHPGVATLPAQDSFHLVGLALHPGSQRIEIREGENALGGLVVSNLSAVPVSGLTAQVQVAPPGWNTTLTFTNTSLEPGGTAGLLFQVVPNSSGIGSIVLRVTANGGVTNYYTLTLAVAPLTARLVATPGSLFAGMVRGQQTLVNFGVVNEGGLESGPLNVTLPNVDWMRVASPNPMPSLPPGGSNTVTLLLSPPADLDLIPFDGTLQLVSANASLNVPFQFRSLSAAKGDLQISVVDELTYYAQGGPLVSNAFVVLRDPQTHDPITNGVTAANGKVDFSALPEGYYEVEVSAEKHTSYRGHTFLTAGRTNELEVFISRTLVQYIWTVVPTEIEDRTRITIETEFETVVPLPVITMEPAYLDLADLPEPEAQVEFRITNHGLVAAKNVGLELPNDGPIRFETVANDLGDLPAQSSITIPVRVIFPTGAGGGGFTDVNSGAGGGGPINVSRDRCYYYVREKHEIPCGKRTNTYYTVTAVRDSKAQGCSGGASGSSASGQGPLFNGGPLSPYGVASGGGSGVYISPRSVPPADEKCGCEGFVPTCGQLSGSVSVPPVKVFGKAEASLKVNGSAKLCSCCDEDGRGFKKEISASVEGSTKFSLPLTAPDPVVEFDHGGFHFKGGVNLGGVKLDFSPKITGQFQHTEECHGKNPKECFNIVASAEGELSSTLGPEFSVTQNGVDVGKAKATAKIYAKGAVSYSWSQCNGKTEEKACSGPFTVGLTFALTGGYSEVSYNTSVDLLPKTCTGNLGGGSGGSGEGGSPETDDTMARQVAAAMQPAIEEMLAEFRRQNGLSSPAAAPAPSPSPSPTPAATGTGGGNAQGIQGQEPGFSPASGGEVCARVRLRIDQDLVMTRQAFDATLELINRDPVIPLNNVAVNVQIFDINGQNVSELFGQRKPVVFGMGAVDGTGSVAPNSTGRASFILVPTRDAAPTQPTVYFVGGTLAYHLGDLTIEIPLTPAPITVFPDPRLKIQYFHQRDVLADDPFTREILEPSIPYSLAVMIKNNGFGEAKNVRLISGQPQIIENERGLLIDFKIIATEVAGQGLTPSLTADFGRINPGQTKIGRWLMTSTLQGLFINYSATFEHLDSLGKTNLALIDEVTIHEMIRQVHATGIFEDQKPDFLVNDVRDPDDLPDHLYLSDGSTNDVAVVRAAFADGSPAPGDLSVTLTAAMPPGWTYLRVPDPANGAYRLARVLRSDGQVVPVDTNAWQTDRTFIGRTQRPIRENVLHLLDYDSTGVYTLIYEPLPSNDFAPPSSSVAALPAFSTTQIPVSWNGTDSGGGTIASYEIYVAENRGPFIPWLQGVSQQAAIYEGVGGRRYEFYSVATDTAGNREAPPLYADTQTIVALSNHPPTLTLNAPAAINEGETLVITSTASDPEMPVQSLLYTLVAGPPGAILNPGTGRIEWFTSEGSGPSTNLFRLIARDNGLPPLSVTNQVSVIVREVNSTPVLAAIANRTINEGNTLSVTNSALDADLPVQSMTFALGPGAPSGATINAQSGVFRWRPSQTQGGTTNRITIIVSDSGTPSLSATQQFSVIVRDTQADFRLSLGRTNVLRGATSSIPVQLTSGLELTNVRFTLQQPITALTNLSLLPTAPELGSATLTPQGSGLAQITFLPTAGQSFQGDSALASLQFTAMPTGPSLILPLLVNNLEARRSDGVLVANPSSVPGQVVVIGDQPVLEALRAPTGEHRLLLYGRPGRAYEIQTVSRLATDPWAVRTRVPMTNTMQELSWLAPSNEFYRAMEFAPSAPLLESAAVAAGGGGSGGDGFGSGAFRLYGQPGKTYVLESTTNPGEPSSWRTLRTLSLTNSFDSIPGIIGTNQVEIFRVRLR